MSRKSEYAQRADAVSAALRRRANERRPWREALASARGLARILGMCPSIRDGDENTIHEMSDGRLQFSGSGEEICVEESELEQVLVQRGLQDHLWH